MSKAGLIDRIATTWKRRKVALKAVSFAIIGAINSLVDLGVFFFAYAILAMPLVPANVLSWFVAVSGSYVMNANITFRAESGGQLRWRNYVTFIAFGVAGVIVNTAILVVASSIVSVIAAKLIATLAGFLVNFSLSHFIVFRPPRSRTKSAATKG
jgi:putative flippase GtrA